MRDRWTSKVSLIQGTNSREMSETANVDIVLMVFEILPQEDKTHGPSIPGRSPKQVPNVQYLRQTFTCSLYHLDHLVPFVNSSLEQTLGQTPRHLAQIRSLVRVTRNSIGIG